MQRVLALAAPRQHHIETFLRLGVQPRDFFRLVLQIAIHNHRPITGALIQPGSDAIVLTEITTELIALYARIGLRQLRNNLPGVVAAAVLHHDDFKIMRDGFQRIFQPAIKLMQATLCFIDGDNHGNMRHLTSLFICLRKRV